MRIDMVGSETPSPIMSGRRAGLQWRGLTALLALSCIAAVIGAMVTIRLALAAVAGLGLGIQRRREED